MDRFGDKIICNPTVKLEKGNQYSVINIDKINPGYKYVTSDEMLEFTGQSGCRFEDNDVLMARITPCLENGKLAVAKDIGGKGIGSTELFVFRGIEGLTDTNYIYYLLSLKYMRQLAANSMTGASGRQRADLGFIKRIPWTYPTIEVQRKIVECLSTYDELIENNISRIKLLEQMAENLYKEWFVRFRFPGHEDVEFENGLPEGWEVKRLKDYGVVETGKTPSTEVEDNYGEDYLFIKTPDMHGNIWVIDTTEKLSEKGHGTQRKKKLPKGSIMVSCIGTGGVVAINSKEGHTNQQINSIILEDECNREWLYMVCVGLKSTIEMFGATGSTMTNLSKGKFENLKIIEPPYQLRMNYHRLAKEIFAEVEKLMYANDNLIKQRDLLLPRLMSGKLEVK